MSVSTALVNAASLKVCFNAHTKSWDKLVKCHQSENESKLLNMGLQSFKIGTNQQNTSHLLFNGGLTHL